MTNDRIGRATAVSIVIPHHGDPAPTLALVERLRQQSTTRTMQLIVVDDHSPVPFPTGVEGCEIIRRERNGGFGAAVNTGVTAAIHPLLLILNSDLDVPTDFVDRLCDLARPWLPAIIGPRIVDESGRVVATGRRFPTTAQCAWAWLTPLARWRDDPRWRALVGHEPPVEPDRVVICDWLVGAALLLPTEEFRRLGGFDERFFMNSEEVDLQRRARAIGLPSVLIGAVTVVHAGGGSSPDGSRRQWLVDSWWLLTRKWGDDRAVARLRRTLTAMSVVNLVWNSGRRLAGRPVAPLATFRAEIDLVRHADGAVTDRSD